MKNRDRGAGFMKLNANRLIRSVAGVIVGAALVAGCTSSAGAGASTPINNGSGGASGSSSGGATDESSFYLRVWQSQALAPQYTFGWLPTVTIANETYIDGMVAVPAIYPGPIYTSLEARSISAAGIDAIVAEARADGLLDGKTDFSQGPMPGSVTVHSSLTVDHVGYELTGSTGTDSGTGAVSPGTPAAFQAFLAKLSGLDTWLGADLGASSPYVPDGLAVMTTPPTDAPSGIVPQQVTWPLAATFATFGSPMGTGGARCGKVKGPDVATLLPVVQAANQLTIFVDSTGAKATLSVRVLVPGEVGPCS
jgi:hypothetical protein